MGGLGESGSWGEQGNGEKRWLGQSRKARVNESSSELGKIRERDRSYESWES